MNDKKMPDSELEIMLVLWKSSVPLRTSEILQRLDNNWALPTLKVLLGRLTQREFILCTRQGRFTLYEAILQENEYRTKETNGLLQRYYQSSAKKLVSALVHDEKITKEDLDEIAKLIAKAGAENE